ncbi:hypothetical protein [Mycolicibacterium bacteremicum]|uniref:Uncharacterized protein n=1 Tax=Mycolicibacterium bacteremicum TaxID=564198 RepID=A0A1W9YN70_MYCBA|nr:hypothetical protein [Mycolicibacterium bacteremicum]MCV7432214.1 hypothetical protein [Mycolicibacterium bacteremicum]ORA01494.1 hypothetical protein BST17_28090 [Mycolicibacterium bacteremicum]
MTLPVVGVLILAAALVVALLGVGVRTLVARRRDVSDDAELDEKILMPTIAVACGLVVTAVFLFGYDLIA